MEKEKATVAKYLILNSLINLCIQFLIVVTMESIKIISGIAPNRLRNVPVTFRLPSIIVDMLKEKKGDVSGYLRTLIYSDLNMEVEDDEKI